LIKITFIGLTDSKNSTDNFMVVKKEITCLPAGRENEEGQ
jgi:hypothetical protein